MAEVEIRLMSLPCSRDRPASQPAGKAGYLVAVDTVSAGFRETVIIVQGSSARMAATCKDCPVDTAIVGIVDAVTVK